MGIGKSDILSVIENVNIAPTVIALVSVNVIEDEIGKQRVKKLRKEKAGLINDDDFSNFFIQSP